MRKKNRRTLVATFWCVIPMLLIAALVFNGCAALEEARQRREKRLLEERNANSLMLKRPKSEITDANIKLPDALSGESDHYTIKFAEDLLQLPAFDEADERREFAKSALTYMESLYDAMREHFGFHPEHKIHVTLHDTFRGSRLGAITTTQYRRGMLDGRYVKYIEGISMDFPMQMYEKHGVRAHELTHAFTNIYYIPVWFSEGIAVLIQTEYMPGGGLHPKLDSLKADARVDIDGVNELENWGGHTENSPLTQWRYRYAYTLVAELWEQYGADFYIKVFELMEADGLHQQLEDLMPTSILVYYFSQAAGEDLVPFFQKLYFKVQHLTKADIIQYVEGLNQNRRHR